MPLVEHQNTHTNNTFSLVAYGNECQRSRVNTNSDSLPFPLRHGYPALSLMSQEEGGNLETPGKTSKVHEPDSSEI